MREAPPNNQEEADSNHIRAEFLSQEDMFGLHGDGSADRMLQRPCLCV